MERRRLVSVLVITMIAMTMVYAQRGDRQTAADVIVKADEAFNQSVQERNLSRFLSFIGENATFSGGMPNEIKGRDAVAKDWAPFFEKNGPTLVWKPIKGELLGAGDLGYTVGTSEFRSTVDGKVRVRHGNYLTVWRKQADGSWKVVYD